MIIDSQPKLELDIDSQIRSGKISVPMTRMFREAETYASANSMLWLGGRLTLMKERLSICLPLEIASDQGTVLLHSVDDLFRWAKEFVPSAYACFLK